MSVFKALSDIVYYPNGPTSRKEVMAGAMINLPDELDYIVGSQIHPDHVQMVDPAVVEQALAAAAAAQDEVIVKSAKDLTKATK